MKIKMLFYIEIRKQIVRNFLFLYRRANVIYSLYYMNNLTSGFPGKFQRCQADFRQRQNTQRPHINRKGQTKTHLT